MRVQIEANKKNEYNKNGCKCNLLQYAITIVFLEEFLLVSLGNKEAIADKEAMLQESNKGIWYYCNDAFAAIK